MGKYQHRNQDATFWGFRMVLWLCLVHSALSIQAIHHKHKHHHTHSTHSKSNSNSDSNHSHQPIHAQPDQQSAGPVAHSEAVSLLETSAGLQTTVKARLTPVPSLFATPIDLTQATVRLVGGDSPNAGRVEVLHDGVWGTICDDGFDKSDGDVVCKQLGLGEATSVSCCGAFGQGTGQIWLSNLACAGKEVRLVDCPGTAWRATGSCTHAEDAGVTCSAVDCQVSEYDLPTPCTASCGGGESHRVRRIVVKPTPEGRQCPKQMDIVTACNTQPCPVDCELSAWGQWDTCSFTCGGGTQTRVRTIKTAPLNAGRQCESLIDTQLCNTNECPLDCVAGEWSSWAECDKPCGVGERSRARIVLSPSQFGGRDCGMLQMKQACNTAPCPVDCAPNQWGAWSDCSFACGNGTRSRTRDVAVFPNTGGAACPALSEREQCNTDPCPVNCILSDWSDWSACDRTCGNGAQSRTRFVTQPPLFDGLPCGDLSQTQACNQEPCRMDYIRNLIDRVRRLELQNRVAKLEQLQAKLAGLAVRDRAKEIIDQANSMKDAAAPFFIPVTVPPVVDQSSAGSQIPTVDPFPQSPARSSSSVPLASSSAASTLSSSTGVGAAQLVSLYEKLDPFPSPLLIETHEDAHTLVRSHGAGKMTRNKIHKRSGMDDAVDALWEVGRAPALDPETRQNAVLALADLVASDLNQQ